MRKQRHTLLRTNGTITHANGDALRSARLPCLQLQHSVGAPSCNARAHARLPEADFVCRPQSSRGFLRVASGQRLTPGSAAFVACTASQEAHLALPEAVRLGRDAFETFLGSDFGSGSGLAHRGCRPSSQQISACAAQGKRAVATTTCVLSRMDVTKIADSGRLWQSPTYLRPTADCDPGKACHGRAGVRRFATRAPPSCFLQPTGTSQWRRTPGTRTLGNRTGGCDRGCEYAGTWRINPRADVRDGRHGQG